MRAEEVGVSSPAALMLGSANSSIPLSLPSALPALPSQSACVPSSAPSSSRSPASAAVWDALAQVQAADAHVSPRTGFLPLKRYLGLAAEVRGATSDLPLFSLPFPSPLFSVVDAASLGY